MHDISLGGMHVLVLEDEFLIALDVEQLCRDHGAAEVVIIRDFSELGPELLARHTFHAAVLDLMLGGHPTTTFASLLVERAIPFVFATGYTDGDGLLDDFTDVPVVGKPFAGRELIAALDAVIAAAVAESGGS